MASHDTPTARVLFLGHSFIVLRDYIEHNPKDLDLAFKIQEPAAIIWHSVAGRRGAKTCVCAICSRCYLATWHE